MSRYGPVLDWKEISHFNGLVVYPRIPDKNTEPEVWDRLYKYATKKRIDLLRSYENGTTWRERETFPVLLFV